MDTFTHKKLQKYEIEILNDFDKFCNKEGLKYFLIGGALLGSVRHKGFIPWDDDIDVAMYREDYERLQEIWVNKVDGKYFLQSGKTDPLFARGILKMRLNGTHIIENACENVSMNDGIYIDIFPIDFVENNSKIFLEKRAKKIRHLMTLRTIKSGYKEINHTRIKKVIRFLIKGVSINKIDRMLFKLCTRDNNKNRNYAILFLHNYPWYKQIHPIEVFGDGCKCVFENCLFNAPQKCNLFLERVFGKNYMEEPPKSMQKNPHNYIKIDFGDKN